GRVHQLQGLKHVHTPVEIKVDLNRAAACDGTDVVQTRNSVDRLFQRASNHDLHLFDRSDAVVYTDNDSGEVSGREDGDRNREREIDANGDESEDDEHDRLGVLAGPVFTLLRSHFGRRSEMRIVNAHFSSLSSFLSSFSSLS